MVRFSGAFRIGGVVVAAGVGVSVKLVRSTCVGRASALVWQAASRSVVRSEKKILFRVISPIVKRIFACGTLIRFTRFSFIMGCGIEKMALETIKTIFQKYGYIGLFLIALLVFLIYPNVGIYDWDKEVLYTAYIKTSILEYKQFPLFLWNSADLAGYPAVDQSAFFAANPETMLFTPFLPLLFFLSPVVFLKLLVVLNAVAGWVGVEVLAKKLRWQPAQLRVFSALFFLSPIVFQHVAIGYLPWINLYLIPWLLYFALMDDLLPRSVGCGMVLALVLLQGGLHVFVWLAFFTTFYLVSSALIQKRWNQLLSVPLTFLSAIGMAFPRFYLSLQTFSSFSQRFFAGYSLPAFFRWALVPPFFTPASMDDIEYFIESYIDGVPYWDGALFWGLLIILILFLPFLFANRYRRNKQSYEGSQSSTLAVGCASALLLVFSFDGLYEALITFVSGLLRLPALEGMEKYPFRFAIPAYFGFAFVIAADWVDLPVFIHEAIAGVYEVLKKLARAFRTLCGKLRRGQRVFAWLAGVLAALVLASFAVRPALLGWINRHISLAHAGQGADWLAQRMQRASSVPLQSYVSKAAALYGYGQRFLLIATLLFALLWLFGLLRFSGKAKEKPGIRCSRLPAVLEGLLVVPLLLAFGMWWRVALATPQNTVASFQMNAPQIIVDASQDVPEVEITSFSPGALHLSVTDAVGDSIIVLSDVPARDARFLEISPGSASLVDHDDRLGIQVQQNGEIEIYVDHTAITIPMLIAVVSWLLAAGMLLRGQKRSNHHG